MRDFATYTAEDLARITATPLTLGVALGDEFPDGKYTAYPWLRYVEQQVLAALYRPGNEIIIVSIPFQTGKAETLDTPIPTPSGWTTMGEVAVGDEVIGADGRPCRVEWVSDVQWKPIHRVAFDDGSTINASPDHQWTTFDKRERESYLDHRKRYGHPQTYDGAWWDWASPGSGRGNDVKQPHVRTTAELLASQQTKHGEANHGIPNTHPLDLPERSLPIDPWVLGYWLGNGARGSGAITTGGRNGRSDLEFVHPRTGGNPYSVGTNRATITVPGLITKLKALGIEQSKTVPPAYMRASIRQRLELLRGLMDSDGTPENTGRGPSGRVSFSSKDEHLTRAVGELAVSLGAKVHYDDKRAKIGDVDYGPSYRVSFTPPFCPFTLPRKAERWADPEVAGRGLNRNHRLITSIENTGVLAPMKCIGVSGPGSLFLCGEQMVPTHNSSYFSLLFPSWYLGRYPNRTWLNISYNDDRAKAWGRASRNLLRRHGPKLFGVNVDIESDSAGEWHFAAHQGGMISSGIRSTVNGVTAHVISLDDTLKGMEEANSPPVKRRNMDEFDSVIMGRCQSNPIAPTKIFIINTRLVEDDLGGELLDRARQPGYEGFPVTLINIKAIAEPDPEDMAGMTDEDLAEWRDCLGRSFGEPLECRHTAEFFRLRQASMPAGMWMAQYQGIPTFSEASMFPEHHWRYWVHDEVGEKLPEDTFLPRRLAKRVRVWDLAASEGGGDWTVGTLVGLADDGRVFILERERFQHAPGGVEERVKLMAEQDGYEVAIRIEQERQGSGITTVDHYKRELVGYDIDGIKAEGVKESRATPYSILQNANKVYLPRHADWTAAWIKEHAQMDGKGKRPKHDDQIDTAAYAVKFLVGAGQTMIFDPNAIGTNRQDLTDDEIMDAMLVRQMLGFD